MGEDEPSPSTTFDDLDRGLGIRGVWARGFRGQGVTVAIIDSGIDAGVDFEGTVSERYDLTGGTGPITAEATRHGTAVARLVHLVGPQAQIADFNVWPRRESWGLGSRVRNAVVRALEQCIAAYPRYRVINISLSLSRGIFGWRCAPGRLCAVCRAVNRASEKGAVVVIAAGNYGPRPNTIECPGLAQGGITVGASWSPAEQALFENTPTARAHFGTSFAAPLVAGGVALLLSAAPSATPELVRTAIRSTAQPLAGASPDAQGAGLANFARALRVLIGPSEREFDDAERRLYAVAGNAEAQRTDNAFVTGSLDVALDYVEKTLLEIRQDQAGATQALERIRGYLVPGCLAAYEQRIEQLFSRTQLSRVPDGALQSSPPAPAPGRR